MIWVQTNVSQSVPGWVVALAVLSGLLLLALLIFIMYKVSLSSPLPHPHEEVEVLASDVEESVILNMASVSHKGTCVLKKPSPVGDANRHSYSRRRRSLNVSPQVLLLTDQFCPFPPPPVGLLQACAPPSGG